MLIEEDHQARLRSSVRLLGLCIERERTDSVSLEEVTPPRGRNNAQRIRTRRLFSFPFEDSG